MRSSGLNAVAKKVLSLVSREIDLKKWARMLEKILKSLSIRKSYLQLWVKVKKGWSDNERALQSLGFND